MGEPIRALCVFGALNRGGAETMCMNLYRNIDRTKVQFDFVKHTAEKCAYDDEIESLGGRVYSAPRYRVYNTIQYKNWWKKHLAAHPEHKIIHAHMFTIASVYLKVCKNYDRLTICHSHIAKDYSSSIKDRIKKHISKNVSNYADYRFACSKLAGDFLYGGRDYIVLNNAIETGKFLYDSKTASDIRGEFHISEDEFVVGTVGRLTRQKNPDKIIAILSAMQKKGVAFKFLWIGIGELEQGIKEKLASAGLHECVIMTGSRGDVNELMMAMDVFLLPSLFEGLPVTVVEAQASGLPCVISNTITDEVCVTDLVTRLPLDASDDEWSDALIANKKRTRKNTSKQIAEAGYDVKSTAQWLQDFYLKLADSTDMNTAALDCLRRYPERSLKMPNS